MTQSQPDKDLSARSPFAGCAILIAAMVVMTFLIGFSVLTLFRQFNEIAKFTGEKPVTIEVTPLENKEPELNNLAERVETFRQGLAGDYISTLSLSADDVNLAIASYDAFKELRGTFRVTGIEGDQLRIAISFPLNGRPRLTKEGEKGWIASDSRYLNATMIASPRFYKDEVLLAIDRIEVPGVTVPQEFIDQMSPYRITERYLTDKEIGPAMKKFTRLEISDGKIVITRNPKETPVDSITDKEVDAGATRLFTTIGIAACAFLGFAGIIVLLGVRAKARKARNS
ncbi:MAG: hypothetical protein ABIS50_15410 [Luteolibacter sp.]|uniref:hypothetical protein n=1 Tax=Luteolibacter sp. TaxID=1962973 RepID=UPI0032677D28